MSPFLCWYLSHKKKPLPVVIAGSCLLESHTKKCTRCVGGIRKCAWLCCYLGAKRSPAHPHWNSFATGQTEQWASQNPSAVLACWLQDTSTPLRSQSVNSSVRKDRNKNNTIKTIIGFLWLNPARKRNPVCHCRQSELLPPELMKNSQCFHILSALLKLLSDLVVQSMLTMFASFSNCVFERATGRGLLC